MSQNYIIRSAATLHNFAKMLHIAWRCRIAHDAHHPRRIPLMYNMRCNPWCIFVDVIPAYFVDLQHAM